MHSFFLVISVQYLRMYIDVLITRKKDVYQCNIHKMCSRKIKDILIFNNPLPLSMDSSISGPLHFHL